MIVQFAYDQKVRGHTVKDRNKWRPK